MILRTDAFRDLERLTDAVFGTPGRPAPMPLDAHRTKDALVLEVDLPGVSPDTIDVTVEHGALTIRASRIRRNEDRQAVISERPFGTFERRVLLGDTLDTDRVEASYHDGVLTLQLPVQDRARARKVEVHAGAPATAAVEASSSDVAAPA